MSWAGTAQPDRRTTAELVTVARTGDEQAWAALVARFDPALRATVTSYDLDPTEAAGVVERTWLLLVDELGAVPEPEHLGGWLVAAARREAARAVDQRGR